MNHITNQTEYKDSPVGRIPAGWQSSQLGDVLEKIIGGGTPSRMVEEYWNGDIPWATVKDLTKTKLSSTQETITQSGLDKSASNMIPSETISKPKS